MIFILATTAIIPAFAQNVSMDEEELKIQEEIKACEKEVKENDSMTEAEKTVAKRNCVTDVRNKYVDENISHKQTAEIKSKLQNMQRCEDWHDQYRYVDEKYFKIQKNYDMVRDCITLYEDPIWDYEGDDRLYVLAQKLDEIKANQVEPEIVDVIATAVPQQYVPIVPVDKNEEKIAELEAEVEFLKSELVKKERIIQEQIKVLLDLTNQFRNTLGQIQSFFSFDSFKI